MMAPAAVERHDRFRAARAGDLQSPAQDVRRRPPKAPRSKPEEQR
jgi:hypothetical protein